MKKFKYISPIRYRKEKLPIGLIKMIFKRFSDSVINFQLLIPPNFFENWGVSNFFRIKIKLITEVIYSYVVVWKSYLWYWGKSLKYDFWSAITSSELTHFFKCITTTNFWIHIHFDLLTGEPQCSKSKAWSYSLVMKYRKWLSIFNINKATHKPQRGGFSSFTHTLPIQSVMNTWTECVTYLQYILVCST